MKIDKMNIFDKIDFIKEIVAIYLEVDFDEYKNPRRFPHIVKLKHYATYFSKRNTIATEEQLMICFGYKNHASVSKLMTKIENLLKWNKQTQKEIKEIATIIQLRGLSLKNNIKTNQYYFINMNNFTSLRENSEKSLIFVGYNSEEIEKVKKLLNLPKDNIEVRVHKNTSKFIIEPLKRLNTK